VNNPTRLHLEDPLEIDEARRAARRMSEVRRAAEHDHEQAVEKAADAEAAYRKAYSQAFIKATGTAAEREAIAKADSAKECRERDITAGMVKVSVERLRGLEGERSMLKSLMDWSRTIWERENPPGLRNVA
jgi:hypothetical protein